MHQIKIEPDPAGTEPDVKELALFSLGFRPFFLMAGVLVLGLMVSWLLILSGVLQLQSGIGTVFWHQHEMLFGYTLAVIAGFLLTAVENWTGIPMPQGTSLIALSLVWLAGRIAFYLPVPILGVALIDALFPIMLACVVAIPIIKKQQWHNIMFPLLLLSFAGASLLSYANAANWQGVNGHHFALGLTVTLIIAMTCRLLPFFIGKVVPSKNMPTVKLLNNACILIALMFALLQAVVPFTEWTAIAAFITSILFAANLIRWYTHKIWSAPLLWSMYVSAWWIAIGVCLAGVAALGGYSLSMAMHILTIGGIGLMTVSVMTRVSLGHSGRAMISPASMVWAFGLLNLAVVFRSFFPVLMPGYYSELVLLSGVCWVVAFGIFVVRLMKIWLTPSVSQMAG